MLDQKLNKIRNHYNNGKLSKAESLCKRLINEYPTENIVKLVYLDLLFKNKKYTQIINFTSNLLKRDKQNIDYIKFLSLSCLELGLIKRAEKNVKDLISFDPNPANYDLLGIVASKNKNISLANQSFAKAIELSPDNHKFIMNFANFFRKIDQNDKALNLLLGFNKRKSNIDILILITAIYRDIRNHEKAEFFCLKALSLNNNNDPNLLFISGVIRSEMGKKEEAIIDFKKSISINSNLGPAYRMLSLLNYKFQEEKLTELINSLSGMEVNINTVHIGLAISNYLEKEGEFEKSFNYLKKYNSIYKKFIDYKHSQSAMKFENIKKIFKIAKHEKIKFSEDAKKKYIFIVGLPRSGTSLVEQVLSSHSKIHGGGELVYLEKTLFENCGNFEQIIINDFSKETALKIKQQYQDKNYFSENFDYATDKLPLNFFYSGLIKIFFPESKIILCQRNKMDNVYSIFRTFFPSGNLFSYDLNDLRNFYILYMEIIKFWNDEGVEFINVEYEKLINNFEPEVKKMFTSLKIVYQESCINFYQNKRVVQTASFDQVRKPIFKSSIEKWKNYKNQLAILSK